MEEGGEGCDYDDDDDDAADDDDADDENVTMTMTMTNMMTTVELRRVMMMTTTTTMMMMLKQVMTGGTGLIPAPLAGAIPLNHPITPAIYTALFQIHKYTNTYSDRITQIPKFTP